MSSNAGRGGNNTFEYGTDSGRDRASENDRRGGL